MIYFFDFIHIFMFRYGKTKDAFGWPEEIEDIPTGQSTSAPVTTINSETDSALSVPASLSSVDRYVNIKNTCNKFVNLSTIYTTKSFIVA